MLLNGIRQDRHERASVLPDGRIVYPSHSATSLTEQGQDTQRFRERRVDHGFHHVRVQLVVYASFQTQRITVQIQLLQIRHRILAHDELRQMIVCSLTPPLPRPTPKLQRVQEGQTVIINRDRAQPVRYTSALRPPPTVQEQLLQRRHVLLREADRLQSVGYTSLSTPSLTAHVQRLQHGEVRGSQRREEAVHVALVQIVA